jgi:hypothetical protein
MQTYSAHPLKQLFANNHWGFIEDEFIIKPEKKYNHILQRMKRWLPAMVTCIAGGYGADLLAKRYVPTRVSDNFNAQNFVRAIGTPSFTALSGIGMYRLTAQVIEAQLRYEVLERFITEWPENKQFTPRELHESFEELYNLHMHYGKDHLKELASEMDRLIRNNIYNHFPLKYADRLNKNTESISFNFWHTIVSIDIAKLIKALGNFCSLFFNEK